MAPDPKAGGSFNKNENEVDKTEEAKKVQQSIKGYEHRYRIALRDRLSTKDKLDLKLGKQQKILDKLQEDRMELVSKTFISEQSRRREVEFLECFVDYIREKAFLESEVKNIREEMKELDKRTKNMEREIKRRTSDQVKRKVRMTGMDSSNDRAEATVNTLENKLSQARRGLNEIIMVCKEYRREIDDCLLERQKFRVILDSVTTKLKVGKGCMLDMIEQAAVATAKREGARERLKKLISDHKRVTSKQAYLFRELHTSVNVLIDRAMFQSVKIQRRIMKGLEAKRQLTALIRRQDIENQILQTKLILNHLKHLYRLEDSKEVGRLYSESNDIIISLVNYSSQSFMESDKAHKSNAILQFSCNTIKKITNNLIHSEYKMLMDRYSEYTDLTKEVEDLEKKVNYAKTLKEFTILRLNMMYHKAGCNVNRYAKLLGDNTKIHPDNAFLMVKEIERRMVQLIGMLYLSERLIRKDQLPLKRFLLYLPQGDEIMSQKLKFYGMGVKTPCPVCAEAEHFGLRKESKVAVEPFAKMKDEFIQKAETEEVRNHLHSVSHCHLPGSRRLLQQRFLKLGY